jgi:allophanate hydrolase subunit 2
VLRVVPGPQADWFYSSADSGEYVVSEDSDRMGVRLSGPRLPVRDKRQLLTEGVSLGAVQVPSDGAPIILFVDHQTTGGYPKIANVILADMWKVGQLRPRDKLRFETVTIERALAWLREQEHWIDSV